MKQFKHKKTDIIVNLVEYSTDNTSVKFYENPKHEVQLIPELVEDSNDWEEVVEHKYIVIRYKDSAGNIYYRKFNGKFTINLQYEYDEDKLINRELSIDTIRRVSDGVNFSVGDKVVWDWIESGLPYFTITKFFYKDNQLKFATKEGSDFRLNKMLLSHYKSEVLYRSYDGYDICEGDAFHAVQKNSFNTIENCQYKIDNESNYLIFKNKDNMYEYVWLNKPCLSINDVAKVYVTANRKYPKRPSGWEKQAEQLIEIVKKKIN